MTIIRWLLAALMFLVPAASVAQSRDSSYIKVPNEDPEMALAKTTARESLDKFWERFRNPGPDESGFALKVAVPYGSNSTEHIWTKDIEVKDGRITAVINNVPRDVKTVKLGQRINVDEARISDWMYLRAGKMVGNYTMRPLLKRMRPADAARYRAMLADP